MNTEGFIKLDGDYVAIECRRMLKFFKAKNDAAYEAYKAKSEARDKQIALDIQAEKDKLLAYREQHAYDDFIRIRDKNSHPCKHLHVSWFGWKKTEVTTGVIYDWVTTRLELIELNSSFWYHTDHHEIELWGKEDILKWDWFLSKAKPPTYDPMVRNLYRFIRPYDVTLLRDLVDAKGELYLSIHDYNTFTRFQIKEKELIDEQV